MQRPLRHAIRHCLHAISAHDGAAATPPLPLCVADEAQRLIARCRHVHKMIRRRYCYYYADATFMPLLACHTLRMPTRCLSAIAEGRLHADAAAVGWLRYWRYHMSPQSLRHHTPVISSVISRHCRICWGRSYRQQPPHMPPLLGFGHLRQSHWSEGFSHIVAAGWHSSALLLPSSSLSAAYYACWLDAR